MTMQLLLEILSEEIPARMQAQAGRDLQRLFGEALAKAGLQPESLHVYAGPRRLTLVAEGLPAATPDQTEEIKGPRATAPPQALEGFLRKTGLTREQLTERDGVLFAALSRPGRSTPEIAAEALTAVMRGFPWPKSMRSGRSQVRWVRPIRRILFLLDGAVIPFSHDGLQSGNETQGHRFMGSGQPFTVRDFADYRAGLEREFVILDAADRRARILDRARALCAAEGLELIDDEGLLDEVSGLAEWPTPVLGAMDPAFLDLPPEVIRTSMRTHQKYFAVRRPGEAGLAPRFLTVANIEASDGGGAIAAGNARVLSARLNDARFFWDEDRRSPPEAWLEKLGGVTFHAKLGTMAERVERITALARELAPLVGADPELAATAARLAKADLASGMVGEFPELQGVMGGYYLRAEQGSSSFPLDGGRWPGGARSDGGDLTSVARSGAERADSGSDDPSGGESTLTPDPSPIKGEGRDWRVGLTREQIDAVADAVRDHYKPQGPNDAVPTAPMTVAVALADKLDQLVGFFAVDEKPTGSKDPYALRRAALGVIRILLEGQLRAPLRQALKPAGTLIITGRKLGSETRYTADLLAFFADRLKVLLRDQGRRHDLVDAVFALGDDDLVRIVARVEALSAFLATEDGANLLAGYKRAVNILRAEAKKTGESFEGVSDPAAFTAEEERTLHAAADRAAPQVDAALAAEDFEAAMTHLAALRAPVDAFFDRVLVNDPDAAVRLNRLRLLGQVRDLMNRVADFGQVAG